MEEWRDVVGYEDIYQVSDHGRVRRIAPGRGARPGYVLKPVPRRGYLYVTLSHENINNVQMIHRLVLLAFVGPAGPDQECNHKNGTKSDNYLANLEWITHQGNITHAIDELGVSCRRLGEANSSAKLTTDLVRAIRRLYATGHYTHQQLASQFAVHPSTVGRIIQREQWKHVQD